MDTIKTLDELAQLMEKYNLSEISVEDDGFKASMSKKPPMPPMPPMAPMAPVAAAPAAPVIQQINGDVNTAETKPASGKIVKSPIIGTFYSSPAPGKPAFVSVGSKISKGSVICIVESMKLMNEITSEFDGTVAEIFVNDGEAVEFDQPLMRVE